MDVVRVHGRGVGRWVMAAAVVGTCVVATPALAANKSLPVAVANLPSDIEIIGTVDATIARSTKLYSTMVPPLLSLASNAQSGLDEVKKTCGFDPLTAFDDVTLAVDSGKNGAAFVGVNVKESDFTACIVALGKKKSGADITTSKKGNAYTITAPSGTYYFAWLPGDVIAFTKNPKDEKELARFTGGAGALASNKALTGWIAMADPNALVMVATTRSFSQGPMSLDGGVGSIVYKSGAFDVKLTIEVGSKSKAESIEKGAGMVKSLLSGKGPSELQTILGTLDVKASGTQVVAKASGTETDVSAVLGWLIKGMP